MLNIELLADWEGTIAGSKAKVETSVEGGATAVETIGGAIDVLDLYWGMLWRITNSRKLTL